jgi:ankyrin repeat protein
MAPLLRRDYPDFGPRPPFVGKVSCLAAGVDINSLGTRGSFEGEVKGENAITAAVSNGRLEVVRYLAEHGANLSSDGLNLPLWWAVAMGRMEILQFLLQRGANPNEHSYGWDETPLCAAVRMRNLQAARLLLDAGAQADEVCGMVKPLPGYSYRGTAIGLAAAMQNTAMIELLQQYSGAGHHRRVSTRLSD